MAKKIKVSKEKAKKTSKFKPEYIAYIVIGVMIVAIVTITIVIFATTSPSGNGTLVEDCCRLFG